MPSISNIIDSVKTPRLIKDPFIKGASFDRMPSGEPVRYTGGFTVVFPVTVNGEKWAFRCWHTDLGNMRSRMELLSAALKENPLPYFCDFVYVDEGIVVDGKILPTTRMRWVEGVNILEYISRHVTERQTLMTLADKFLAMCRDLHKLGYAHGDLQHENIIVGPDGELRLIDYDSMFVPSMQGEYEDIIIGKKDYQHPKRTGTGLAFSGLDYFSELIIYTSILAIAHNPALSSKYEIEKAERLLFSKADYEAIKESDIYQDIAALQGNFPLLLHVLEEYLDKNEISQLEPFDVLLNRYAKVPNIKLFEAIHGRCVYKGDRVALHWDVENYTCLYINEKLIDSSSQNIFKETIASDKIYCLRVVNGLHEESSEIEVQVVEKPSIHFRTTTKKLREGRGEYATLEWSIENAISAVLIDEGQTRPINLIGKKEVSPKESTTYLLKVKGLDGKKYFEKKLTLNVFPESQIEFKADKLYSLPRVPILIAWNVCHASSVELIGYGIVSDKGTKIVEIDKDTSFELKVRDAFGIQTQKLDIKILPLPVIKSIMVSVPQMSKSIVVQSNQTHLQAMVTVHDDLMVSTSTFGGLNLQPFETLHIKMHEYPCFAGAPKYNRLHFNISKNKWWKKIMNQFIDLNNKCKKLIFDRLWKTSKMRN